MQPSADVPCNGCTLCCERDLILLYPEYGDDPALYETQQIVSPLTGAPAYMLTRKADGTCRYLAKGEGCAIHERRPAMCRAFDCRGFYLASGNRAQRREMIASGATTKAILDRGRELLRQAAAEDDGDD